MNFIKELKWRGMIHDIMPETESRLSKGMATGYVGYDPTAPSLHLGHLVPIMMQVHFQRAGHKPIALIGGAIYLAALYLTSVVVAALIGVSLVRPKSEGLRDFGVALLVGVLILTVATHIPLLGGILRIVVALVGLGLLTDRARRAWTASRPRAAQA